MKLPKSEAEPSPSYSYLDTDDINNLRESGYVEIANHSYDMHLLDIRQGTKILDNEDYDTYRSRFLSDIIKTQKLLEDDCGFRPNVYTYPYGLTCDPGIRLVKNYGFEASLGVEEKPNYITEGDVDCLYNMNRYNRPSHLSTKEFMEMTLRK